MQQRKIRIGSRESPLARRQSELIMQIIAKAHPEITLELVTMKTTGDRILDRPLDKIGGKGLFVKELDIALSDGRIDLSVHSLKDMPMQQPEELPIVAFSKRADARDVLILPQNAQTLNPQKPIGCSSARRRLQLAKLFPQMRVQTIRGNVQTRLTKLETEYSALVLAYAGLERLDMCERIHRIFSPEEMLPAAGQGILSVQGRAGEDFAFLSCVDDENARIAALAERSFVRVLDGGCSSPIAAYAQIAGRELKLTGLFAREDAHTYLIREKTGLCEDAQRLGEQLANEVKKDL